MEWLDDDIARLRADWDAGYSAAEIGRRNGWTKNAVVGKAHRLDLPGRPSPIIRGSDPNRPPAARRHKVRRILQHQATLVVLPSLHAGDFPTIPLYAQPPLAKIPKPAVPQPARAPAPYVPPIYGRVVSCCWPEGEPGTKAFHFCEAKSVPGKPYCLGHCQTAYRSVHDRREDDVIAQAAKANEAA